MGVSLILKRLVTVKESSVLESVTKKARKEVTTDSSQRGKQRLMTQYQTERRSICAQHWSDTICTHSPCPLRHDPPTNKQEASSLINYCKIHGIQLTNAAMKLCKPFSDNIINSSSTSSDSSLLKNKSNEATTRSGRGFNRNVKKKV